MLIWVTRTAPDNFLTARRLMDMGHRTLLVPTLEAVPVDHEPLSCEPAAILFTSANGVRHHKPQPELAHVPVFAVGSHASELAIRAGYLTVTSTGGDADLAKILISLALPLASRIVHFAAREVGPTLPDHIRSLGHDYDQVAVYEVAEAAAEPALGSLKAIDAVTVHSAKAAARAAQLLQRSGWQGKVWALSDACKLPFAEFVGARVLVASQPTERALLDLVPDLTGRLGVRSGVNADLMASLDEDLTLNSANDP